MARSITTKPATVKSKVQDPYTQPCFSIFSNDQTVYGGGWFLFDHNLEPIAKYSGDGDYHYNQFRTYSSYAPEFWNSYSGDEYMLTTSHVSSNTNRGGNTCNVGYLGHIGYPSVSEYTKTAGYVRGWPGVNRAAYGFRDVNSIVGDINQDWAWFTNNDSGDAYHRMYFGPRNTIKLMFLSLLTLVLTPALLLIVACSAAVVIMQRLRNLFLCKQITMVISNQLFTITLDMI
jgi:hypothetical protein